MSVTWKAIKEWSGLPEKQRQWASFAVVIIALSSALTYVYLSKDSSAATKDLEIKELNEVIRLVNERCDSVVATTNFNCQKRIDDLNNENRTNYKDQVEELKRNQSRLESIIDRTIYRSEKIIESQERASKKLTKTINQLSK